MSNSNLPNEPTVDELILAAEWKIEETVASLRPSGEIATTLKLVVYAEVALMRAKLAMLKEEHNATS